MPARYHRCPVAEHWLGSECAVAEAADRDGWHAHSLHQALLLLRSTAASCQLCMTKVIALGGAVCGYWPEAALSLIAVEHLLIQYISDILRRVAVAGAADAKRRMAERHGSGAAPRGAAAAPRALSPRARALCAMLDLREPSDDGSMAAALREVDEVRERGDIAELASLLVDAAARVDVDSAAARALPGPVGGVMMLVEYLSRALKVAEGALCDLERAECARAPPDVPEGRRPARRRRVSFKGEASARPPPADAPRAARPPPRPRAAGLAAAAGLAGLAGLVACALARRPPRRSELAAAAAGAAAAARAARDAAARAAAAVAAAAVRRAARRLELAGAGAALAAVAGARRAAARRRSVGGRLARVERALAHWTRLWVSANRSLAARNPTAG